MLEGGADETVQVCWVLAGCIGTYELSRLPIHSNSGLGRQCMPRLLEVNSLHFSGPFVPLRQTVAKPAERAYQFPPYSGC